jgi:hypothetical protein
MCVWTARFSSRKLRVVTTISSQNAANGSVYKRHARTVEWNACVDCTALRTLALATPPAALETPDAGLTPTWRRQKRSCRFERAFLYFLIWKFGWRWHAFCEAFQTPRFESSCRMALKIAFLLLHCVVTLHLQPTASRSEWRISVALTNSLLWCRNSIYLLFIR